MSYAVGFALFSLLLTCFNDVLFKRHTTAGRSIGIFVFGVGLLWTFSQWILAQIQDTPIEFNNGHL